MQYLFIPVFILLVAFIFGAHYVHWLGPFWAPIFPFILFPLGLITYLKKRHIERGWGQFIGWLAMLASGLFLISTIAFVFVQRTRFLTNTPLYYLDKFIDIFVVLFFNIPSLFVNYYMYVVWACIALWVLRGVYRYHQVGKEKAKRRKSS